MSDQKSALPFAISPQFNIHIPEDDRILLLSEERSFQLKGKLYVDIASLMDGRRTYDDIFEALKDQAPEDKIRFALDNLHKKKYAAYLDPRAPAPRQALWVELDREPAEAEQAVQGAGVAVRALGKRPGTDRAAAGTLMGTLHELGLDVVGEADAGLVVVVVDDYLDPQLYDVSQHLRGEGRRWLPFKPGGAVPWLGPVFLPDSAPCWVCLSKPLMENRPGDAVAGNGAEAVRPYRGWVEGSLGLARGFAALEVARYLAGETAGGIGDGLVELDLKKRSITAHRVHPQHNCPTCGQAYDPDAALTAAQEAPILQRREILPNPDGGWRVATVEDVLARLEPHISPITGLIAHIEDLSPDPQLPVVAARQSTPGNVNPRMNRKIGRPGAAAGKGESPGQARVSCLAEAVERYCCGWMGNEPRRRARLADFGGDALHPNPLLNYSEDQYDGREETNETTSGFQWVGERFDEKREIEWTPLWSLRDERPVWLPTRFCYFNYVDDAVGEDEEANEFCMSDSNGCASGSTLEEAILQGFLELVERDACAMWWYNMLSRPEIDLTKRPEPFVRAALRHYDSRKRSLYALDLTTDLGVPVVTTLSHNDEGGEVVMGLGAHFDPLIALKRSISELNQIMGIETALKEGQEKGEEIDEKDDFIRWFLNETVETQPYVLPADGAKLRLEDLPAEDFDTIDGAVRRCVDIVAERGMDFIVLDHSRPGIDFSCARVVVPGLRHFWRRLAPGRLYDTPVELGWLSSAKSEPEMNPISFFL